MQGGDGGGGPAAGLSLGAAAGMWLAAKYPGQVASLSLHSAWTASDPFLRAVVQDWQIIAQALASVPEMIIQGIFPWCFTPEMYAARPEYVDSLAEFVRGRPMPGVDSFVQQSGAVLAHDATAVLGSIQAPSYENVEDFNTRTLAFLQAHAV